MSTFEVTIRHENVPVTLAAFRAMVERATAEANARNVHGFRGEVIDVRELEPGPDTLAPKEATP